MKHLSNQLFPLLLIRAEKCVNETFLKKYLFLLKRNIYSIVHSHYDQKMEILFIWMLLRECKDFSAKITMLSRCCSNVLEMSFNLLKHYRNVKAILCFECPFCWHIYGKHHTANNGPSFKRQKYCHNQFMFYGWQAATIWFSCEIIIFPNRLIKAAAAALVKLWWKLIHENSF